MSVAAHLRIDLAEYDRRIRTFIPYYEEMLGAAAAPLALLAPARPVLVDLGVGTGALARRCLAILPRAHLHGIDTDPGMLAVAARRLARPIGRSRRPPRVTLEAGSFLDVALPRCDALVASFALHHIKSVRAKASFYATAHAALRPRGLLVSADCFPPAGPALAHAAMRQWAAHLRRSYSPKKTRAFFEAWAREDRYLPLNQEIGLLRGAGFDVEVVWRRDAFAVLLGRRRPAERRRS